MAEGKDSVTELSEMKDAQEYVDSVMGTPMENCNLVNTNRKRHHSASDCVMSSKKSKCDSENSGDNTTRIFAEARRSLYGKTPGKNIADSCSIFPEKANSSSTQGSTGESDSQGMTKLIIKLSEDVSAMNHSLNHRIDKLEETLETKICHRIGNLLDKRVNAEMKRVKEDVNKQIQSFTEDIRSEMTLMEEKLKAVSGTSGASNGSSQSRQLNVAIRGLLYHEGENLNRKVNSLINEGLNLTEITVRCTERKLSENGNKPGVVIATFQCLEDRRKVLSVKTKLKDSMQYEGVYINKDQSVDERSANRNFKVIVNALKGTGCNVSIQGSRVVQHNPEERDREGPDTRYRNRRPFSRGGHRGGHGSDRRDDRHGGHCGGRNRSDSDYHYDNSRGYVPGGNRRRSDDDSRDYGSYDRNSRTFNRPNGNRDFVSGGSRQRSNSGSRDNNYRQNNDNRDSFAGNRNHSNSSYRDHRDRRDGRRNERD